MYLIGWLNSGTTKLEEFLFVCKLLGMWSTTIYNVEY